MCRRRWRSVMGWAWMMLFIVMCKPGGVTAELIPAGQRSDAPSGADAPKIPGAYRPAEIVFGAYRNMQQLADAGIDDWAFVRRHADGILLHGAYWTHDPSAPAVAERLAKRLREGVADEPAAMARVASDESHTRLHRSRMRLVLETGWPHHFEPADRFATMGRYYAADHLQRLSELESRGLTIDELSVDFRLWVFRLFAQQTPERTSEEIIADVVKQWGEYVDALRSERPTLVMKMTFTPVQLPWRGERPYGTTMTPSPLRSGRWPDYDKSDPLLVDGKPRSYFFEGLDLFSRAFDREHRRGVIGVVTDSPFHYSWEWADPEAQRRHRSRIRAYESWLQSRGFKHTFICNDSAIDWRNLPHDDADAMYADRSMLALIRYQLDGGRADRYLFESWYDGPHRIVPETHSGSMTHMTAHAIRYLKGIGQSMTLTKTLVGATSSVTLTNSGDVSCLPALRAMGPIRAWLGEDDISKQMMTEEGFVPDRLLGPGESITIRVDGPHPEILAYWNPQQPGRSSSANGASGDNSKSDDIGVMARIGASQGDPMP